MNRRGLADFMFTSRRTFFDRCLYWKVDNEQPNRSKLDYLQDEPSGFFDAKLYSQFYNDKNVIAGVFMFDEENVTIITEADLSAVKQNDVVMFREELYRINNISKQPIRTNNQFSDNVGYSYILSLKR